MWNDLKLGVRTALRSPGYSAVAVITMALAIGANTLLFSIANPLVIRPLPIENPDGIGWVRQTNGPRGVAIGRTSMPDFLDFRAQASSFSSLAAQEMTTGTLLGHGDARRVTLSKVTTNLPTVWGLQPIDGRLFLEGEDKPGAATVGVMSHRFWRDFFNADPGVLGRTVLLNGQTVTLVGIMTPEIEFGGLAEIDLWVPLPLETGRPRDERALRVMGTIAPGATVESARAEMIGIADRLAKAYPTTNADWSLSVLPTREAITSGDTWVILGLLGVIVLFVLLIACASLANLVRARLVGRHQDLTVRQALGASRMQVIRPLVSESMVLGLIGGLVGLGLAHAGLKVINAVAFEEFFKTLAIDQYVLAFNVLLSLITPLVFSVWPALAQSRTPDSDALRGGRVRGSQRGRRRGSVLIVSQVAMALALLVVSALAVQSAYFIQNQPLGLNTENTLVFSFEVPPAKAADTQSRRQFLDDAKVALEGIPGVTRASVASSVPVIGNEVNRTLTGTMRDGVREGEAPWASWFAVAPDFFDATGIAVIAGRAIGSQDVADGQSVAVISRLAATRYFDGPASALGRTVQISGGSDTARPVTIVGVVEDTKNSNVIETSPQLYVPLSQVEVTAVTAVLQTDSPNGRIADVRAAMRALDGSVAISVPKSIAQIAFEETSSTRILNMIFSGFAVLALALAAAGLYGVLSFTVGQRGQEFGVRMALGAEPSTVRAMVMRDGVRVTAIGVAIGLVGAYGLAMASSSVLFGITPRDPWTYVVMTMAVAAVALLAVWIPATRAMKVNPVTALRAD